MTDEIIFELIKEEEKRQNTTLNMIASENQVSENILKAQGSCLQNKYAEGYPNKRYYQGNIVVDKIEIEAINRAKELFNCKYVNVQPNSGSPANMAAYFAILETGDTILAMDLNNGGHLTHGCPVNFSGKLYNFVSYGVDETGLLNYDEIKKLAIKHKPKLIVCGFTAYPREVDFEKFKEIADIVGAKTMADISHIAGLIAGGVHKNPFDSNFDIVTTTTHKTLRGPRSAIIMTNDEQLSKKIDKAVFPGLQGGPHMHTIAAKAICFKEAQTEEFKNYSKQIVKNAKVLAEELMENKIELVSNGTDNHLILIDLEKTCGKIGLGKSVAIALEKAGIILNYNTIPNEKSTPFKPSGLRLGTAFLTTQGFSEIEMEIIAKLISKVILNYEDEDTLFQIKEETEKLMKKIKLINPITA